MSGVEGYFDAIPEDAQGLEEAVALSPATARQVRSVIFTGGSAGSLTENILNSGANLLNEAIGFKPGSAEILTPQQANTEFGIGDHLHFAKPVTRAEAVFKNKSKRDELYRQDVLARNDSVGALEGFTYSLVGGIVDPASMALNFVPIVGEAKWGKTLTEAGLATRMARGAWLGFKGGLAQEGLTFASANYAGKDYRAEDAAMGLLSSTVFGAGFEGLSYGLGAAKRAASARLGQPGAVESMVRSAAEARGLNADLVAGIVRVESNFNPKAKNKSGAAGLFQFMPDTWESKGGGDVFDTELNMARGLDLIEENQARLRRELGREPTAGEIYLAHQQGAAGARRLLENPEARAVDVLAGLTEKGKPIGLDRARARITQNGGRADMTAAEFAGLWTSKFDGIETGAEAAWPTTGQPEAIRAMDEIDKAGAISAAIDSLSEQGRVDIGDMVEQAVRRPRASEGLSETDVAMKIPARLYQDDVAVTVRGTEIGVRYAVVEARDLKTSHDDDLVRNHDFPEELQPRDRDRAGSQARLSRMEREFSPKRLMTSPEAEGGAPIISPDGVVESGNGRSIVIRRGSDKGAAYYQRYRSEIEAQGFDTKGMDQPVLVRVRTQAMSGPERVRLTREMNADTSERLSVVEQARVDADALRPEHVGLYQGGALTAVKNDPFARAFLTHAGAGMENDLIDPTTKKLSQMGQERMQAALVYKAFGDRGLVAAIYESANPQIKALGNALGEVAPDWAKMRDMAARGEIADGADTTEFLTEAIAFVRHTRDERFNLSDRMDNLRDQPGLFGVDALTPEAAAYVELFYTDKDFKVQRRTDQIAQDLRDIAHAAMETQPGPDLFGEARAFDVSSQLDVVRSRAAKEGRLDAEQFIDAYSGDRTPDNGPWLSDDSGAQSGDAGGGLLGDLSEGDSAKAEPVGGSDGAKPAKDGVTFKTAKGSTYRVEANGSTTRDKAFRPEHGAKEQGPQPTSQTTVYVSKDDADKLGFFQTQGGAKAVRELKDGWWGVQATEAYGKTKPGQFFKDTMVRPHPEPAPGLLPVEIWNDGAKVHFGNEITEVNAPTKGANEQPAPKVSNPEIQALEAEVAALQLELDGAGDVAPFDKPENLTRAVVAYAACLIKEGV